MNRVLHLPPIPAGIKHFASPSHPDLRFEWHPKNRTLYVIRVGSIPEHAEPLGTTSNEGTAEAMVSMFLKGYREGRAVLAPRLKLI